MKFFLPMSLFVSMAFPQMPTSLAQGAGDNFREAVEFAREKVYPALVNISVVAEEHQGGRVRRFPAAGSGVIVSPAGHVVTNFHVAGNTARIKCTLPSGETIPADIVAGDAMTDLCILKLRMNEREDTTIPIPFATIGDSNDLDVGDHVIAVGNPLTLSSSMTLGIVSNKKRVFTDFTGTEIDEFSLDGETTGIFNQWIQHDALILPGNSGGPLVNLRGGVVGINTRGGGGVGFAIPSDTIKHVLNQALTYGEVRRGWLGISVLPVSKAGLTRGALVSYVTPASPADHAGIQAGDIVTAIDDDDVNVRFFEEVPLFYQEISELPAGSTVEISYERGGETFSSPTEVASLEKFLGEQKEYRSMGITVRDVTGPMAIALRFPSEDGVLVTGVRPGFPFEEAKPAIGSGAVILAMDGEPITDLDSFDAAISGMSEGESFSVRYRSGDEEVVTLVEESEEEKSRGSKELPRAWMGVRTQVMTENVATALGMAGKKGFRVTQVMSGTMAEQSGLLVGDVLVGMDGDPLDASRPQDAEDLRRTIEDMSIGELVEFDILRDGKETTLEMELEESPASAIDTKSATQEQFEFSVRETTFIDRVQRKLPEDVAGVLVTKTELGGWAQISGLKIGDLLVSVDGHPVATIKDFKRVMKESLDSKPRIISFYVLRGYRTHFVFIEPDWSKIEVGE